MIINNYNSIAITAENFEQQFDFCMLGFEDLPFQRYYLL